MGTEREGECGPRASERAGPLLCGRKTGPGGVGSRDEEASRRRKEGG